MRRGNGEGTQVVEEKEVVVLAIRVGLEESGVCEACERVWFVCVGVRGAERGVFKGVVVVLEGK